MKKEVFKTPFFRLMEAEVSGFDRPFHWIESPDCVTVLAVTKDGKVPLVRQYRPALDRVCLELPSGHIDATDASHEAAARRELLEETGLLARELEFLGAVDPDTGRLRARIYCYFARDVVKVAAPRPDLEQIHNLDCTLAELDQMLRDGRMSHAQDMAVILLARLRGLI